MKQKIKQHRTWGNCNSNQTKDYYYSNEIGWAWEQDQSFKMREKSMTWDKMVMNIKYDIKQTSASIVCKDDTKVLSNETKYITNIAGNQILKAKRLYN